MVSNRVKFCFHLRTANQLGNRVEKNHIFWSRGGGTPLYRLCRYVSPDRVGFLRHFGLKTGMVFEGTSGEYERIIVSIPNE